MTGSPPERMLAVAEQALRHYDLATDTATDIGEHRLVPLAESYNTVFRVDTRTARYVLRVGPQHPVHPPGGTALEDRWTRDLAARGLPVPRVVPATDGSPSVQVAGVHRCSVLTWRAGQQPTRPLAAADVADLAALTARLHDASPPLADRPAGSLSLHSVLHFDLPDRLDELDGRSRSILTAARDRAQRAVHDLWHRASTPPRLVHTDLTPANVVRDGHELAAIDFQDLSWGHVEQDLAHSIYGVTRGEQLAAGLASFRAGYERVRPWPDLDLELLTDLIAARRVAMVNFAVHRHRPDLDAYAARHADELPRR